MTITYEEAKNHPYWNDQLELEQEMRSLGIKRFKDALQAARENAKETRMGPMRRLMTDVHSQMVEGIQEFYAEVEGRSAGRNHAAYPYLKPMDIDLVAHLACRVILDTVILRPAMTYLSVKIADALEDEANYKHFAATNAKAYLVIAKKMKENSNAKIRRQVVMRVGRKMNVEPVAWSKDTSIKIGNKLLEIFITKTGLVQALQASSTWLIEMVPEARQWVEEMCRRSEWLSPTYLPTVIPPKPWTSPKSGGYWSGRARRLTLVKTPNRAYLEELANVEMPEVYQAVNGLQDTAWMINRRVYDVMNTLWDSHSTLEVIPPSVEAIETMEPAKPYWLVPGVTKEAMTAEQFEEFKAWKSDMMAWNIEKGTADGKRMSFSRMLWVAEKFSNREFHYPYQLDWRGRAYPVGLYLQPQGNDPQRGLLEFATTAPISDQTAADWLAIHGAGLWGVDKVSFEDRVAWVHTNEAKILASAADPYANLFWTEAEKPWQALAFAFDWAGFKAEGFGYQSALPVQMDGTCNGLQNFSAMLRDPIGGAAVNLIPADKPQDIYMEVANIVAKQVEEDLRSEAVTKGKLLKDGTTIPGVPVRELARMWLGNVTRKVCKRPVMTLAYGASEFGFTNQIADDVVDPWKRERPETYPFGKHGFEAAQYMGGLIWDAVQKVVVAASEAMSWLQQVAQVVSKEGLPINWQTPTGLLVQQHYKLRKMKTIEVSFQKVRVGLKVDQGSDKLDSRKQGNGIAPNFVHALDSSHMMRTICASINAGVTSFSFIHDSYGTHAGNCQFLADTLREEFVRMYSEGCVLERFKGDLEAMLGEGKKLPEVPTKGDLDLSLVLESPFFFA